jgi:dolichyl-phosphate beta-glucosyltransferase
VPAYNEQERIGASLEALFRFVAESPHSYEIVLVDDGSTDETSATAEKTAARWEQRVVILRDNVNRGKGHAIRQGMLAASGDKIFFTDADLSTPPEEIHNCLPWLDRVDVVVGSRALADSQILVHQSWQRESIGRLYNLLVRAAAVSGIRDTQCGFKGFNKEIAAEVFKRQQLTGFGFDVEILYIARKLGYEIAEVPIVWRNSLGSTVNPLKDGIGMLGDLARVRWNDLKGQYAHDNSGR